VDFWKKSKIRGTSGERRYCRCKNTSISRKGWHGARCVESHVRRGPFTHDSIPAGPEYGETPSPKKRVWMLPRRPLEDRMSKMRALGPRAVLRLIAWECCAPPGTPRRRAADTRARSSRSATRRNDAAHPISCGEGETLLRTHLPAIASAASSTRSCSFVAECHPAKCRTLRNKLG
jgi:hypothetical protein